MGRGRSQVGKGRVRLDWDWVDGVCWGVVVLLLDGDVAGTISVDIKG